MVARSVVLVLCGLVSLRSETGCPSGAAIAKFSLLLARPGEEPKPLREMKRMLPDTRLLFRPAGIKPPAEVALILSRGRDGDLEVLDPVPASEPAEWTIPEDVRILALAWSPRGLDQKKIEKRVTRDESLVAQLAAYAEKTQWTESALDALLRGVASQNGGRKLDRNSPLSEQTLSLMRGLNPTLSGYDPFSPEPSVRLQQSAGLAAAVAGMFFGNPVGLTAGSAALFINLRNMVFPKTEFRSGLVQPASGGQFTLCAGREANPGHSRVAYLWAFRIPEPEPPRFTNLPLKVNVGETDSRVTIEGTGLDLITSLTCERAALAPLGPAGAYEIRLAPEAAPGDRLALTMKAEGFDEPIGVPNAIQVLGPRPAIQALAVSSPKDLGIDLRAGEVPAPCPVSVSLRVANSGANPSVYAGCGGQQLQAIRVEQPSAGSLFFTIDPAGAGRPGCDLTVVVETETGRSDPRSLGKVVRLPRIESFRLSGERLGDRVFSGSLEGLQLETIEKVGWDAGAGYPVGELPAPVTGGTFHQRLHVAVPWPSPVPHAPLYVWLRGEAEGRRTTARY